MFIYGSMFILVILPSQRAVNECLLPTAPGGHREEVPNDESYPEV
jgi:hypothetical protein